MLYLQSVLLFAIILPRFVASILLYPASTVLQITSSISLPVTDLPPLRKIFFDWGFQVNYNMPFNVSSFYNVPIWASRSNLLMKREVHTNDFTTMEFYQGMENILQSYGFHGTCLKRSICELANQPFNKEDGNLVTELITLLMTPSSLNNFPPASHDLQERNEYEVAEFHGIIGQSCHQLYSDCAEDLVNAFTGINY